MYKFLFFNALNKRGVEFTNIRNSQFTRVRNKSGNAIFQLDSSPESKQIRAGWLVEIYRNNVKLYFGQIYKRSIKKGLYKIYAKDSIGMLESRLLTQRPDVSQEASLEIIEKLDGLVLVGGYKLSAGEFVEKTNTTMAWHSESNSLAKYIGDIGEKSDNFSNDNSGFFFWITPELDVLFSEDGGSGYYDNLSFTNVSHEEDLSKTFNTITVEGLSILKMPYDGDYWTEGNLNGWHDLGASSGSAIMEYSFYYSDKKVGNACLKAVMPSTKIANPNALRTLSLGDGIFDFQNIKNLHFWMKFDDGGLTVSSFKLILGYHGASAYMWDISVSDYTVWNEINVDLTTTPSFGTLPIGNVDFFYIEAVISGTATTDAILLIDGLYFELEPYSHTVIDEDSVAEHGVLEKKFIARDFYSNAECETLANTLLNYYKDVKNTFNTSFDGFVDIVPNSIIEFTDDGTTYRKVLSAVTYYINTDGSESMQFTISDAKKSDIDVVLDKLAEININNNLLIMPYKVV